MLNKNQNQLQNSDDGEDEPGKLFVGGLSWETTEEKLQSHFGQYGEIVDALVMKNKESGQSRGFGFVTFSDPNTVYEVIKKGPHVIDGRAVDPKPCNTKAAIKTKRNAQYPKVFLGGLPPNITESDLQNAFQRFGNVMNIMIMYDHEKNRCRGFGFLSFEDDECVNRCVAEHFIYVNNKKVEVKRVETQNGRASGQGNHWPQSTKGPGDVSSYQGWGATPTPGYGYGTPTGGPVSYGGWNAMQGQWGPGYSGYPPYNGAPMYPPYGNWNWGQGPQGGPASVQSAGGPVAAGSGGGPVGSTGGVGTGHGAYSGTSSTTGGGSSSKDYGASGGTGSYGSYGSGYQVSRDSSYNQVSQRNSYNATAVDGGTSSGYGGGLGPQRTSQNQQAYHPYRR